MKIRSKQLYQYLLASGVLEATPEAIGVAKLAYRKQYKETWRKRKRPRKEIRIEVTLKQFTAIKAKAHWYELRHTTYARQVILATIESDLSIIPQRGQLEKTLQRVSMAAIAMEKNTMQRWRIVELLQEAETILMGYLNGNH